MPEENVDIELKTELDKLIDSFEKLTYDEETEDEYVSRIASGLVQLAKEIKQLKQFIFTVDLRLQHQERIRLEHPKTVAPAKARTKKKDSLFKPGDLVVFGKFNNRGVVKSVIADRVQVQYENQSRTRWFPQDELKWAKHVDKDNGKEKKQC